MTHPISGVIYKVDRRQVLLTTRLTCRSKSLDIFLTEHTHKPDVMKFWGRVPEGSILIFGGTRIFL